MHAIDNGAMRKQVAHWRESVSEDTTEPTESERVTEAVAKSLGITKEEAATVVRPIVRGRKLNDDEVMALALPGGILALDPTMVPDGPEWEQVRGAITMLRAFALVIGLAREIEDQSDEEAAALNAIAGLATRMGMDVARLMEHVRQGGAFDTFAPEHEAPPKADTPDRGFGLYL